MKIAGMEFDSGNTSKAFKLADGHQYVLHRMERNSKPTLYALVGIDMLGQHSPYMQEHMMDVILSRRSEPGAGILLVDQFDPEKGLLCPGCGAQLTKDGAHFPPGSVPPKDDQPPSAPAEDCPDCDGSGDKRVSVRGATQMVACPTCRGAGREVGGEGVAVCPGCGAYSGKHLEHCASALWNQRQRSGSMYNR